MPVPAPPQHFDVSIGSHGLPLFSIGSHGSQHFDVSIGGHGLPLFSTLLRSGRERKRPPESSQLGSNNASALTSSQPPGLEHRQQYCHPLRPWEGEGTITGNCHTNHPAAAAHLQHSTAVARPTSKLGSSTCNKLGSHRLDDTPAGKLGGNEQSRLQADHQGQHDQIKTRSAPRTPTTTARALA
jgi:hypothetical protein